MEHQAGLFEEESEEYSEEYSVILPPPDMTPGEVDEAYIITPGQPDVDDKYHTPEKRKEPPIAAPICDPNESITVDPVDPDDKEEEEDATSDEPKEAVIPIPLPIILPDPEINGIHKSCIFGRDVTQLHFYERDD